MFCPPNVTMSHFWIDGGFTQCFMDTITSSVCCGFLLIFGTVQLFMYRKYATRLNQANIVKVNCLYGLQIFLIIFYPVLQWIRFLINGTIYKDSHFYGYMVSA